MYFAEVFGGHRSFGWALKVRHPVSGTEHTDVEASL